MTPVLTCLHRLLLTACCFLAGVNLFGQQVVENGDGQRIIVYPDGSWRFFEADSANIGKGLFTPDTATLAANKQDVANAKQEENNYLLALIKLRVGKTAKKLELDSTLQADNPDRRILIELEAEWANLLEKESRLEKQLERSKRKREFYEQILFFPTEVRQRKIEEWNAANVGIEDKTIEQPASAPLAAEIPSPGNAKCAIAYEGKDPNTGQLRKDVEPAVLFSYTEKGLEKHFQSKDLITCTGHLTALSGGFRYLSLEVAIASKNAPKLFGETLAGSPVDIVLLDGTTVRLLNQTTDTGNWLPGKNAYIYKCSYSIGHREEKLLSSNEADKVWFRWSKASQSFVVYNLDFFIDQFRCLDIK